MPKKNYQVFLTDDDITVLNNIRKNGHSSAKTIMHANILLNTNDPFPEKKKSNRELSEIFGVSLPTINEFFRKLTAHENTVVQKYSIFSLPPLLNGVFSFFLYFYQKMFIFLLTYLPICAAVLIVHGQLRRPFDYKKHHLYP